MGPAMSRALLERKVYVLFGIIHSLRSILLYWLRQQMRVVRNRHAFWFFTRKDDRLPVFNFRPLKGFFGSVDIEALTIPSLEC